MCVCPCVCMSVWVLHSNWLAPWGCVFVLSMLWWLKLSTLFAVVWHECVACAWCEWLCVCVSPLIKIPDSWRRVESSCLFVAEAAGCLEELRKKWSVLCCCQVSKKDFVQMTDGSFFNYHFTLLLSVITPRHCFLWCEVHWRNSLCPITSHCVNRSHMTHESKPIWFQSLHGLVCALQC